MRDIKFRVYDTSTKVMWNDIKLADSFWTDGTYQANYCHVMQYTGLTDDNDVEIYEGDIIKCVSQNNDHGQRGAIKIITIKYHMGNVSYSFNESDDEIAAIFPALLFMTKEVIGNIYENEELLINQVGE